ncbi:hypothetical protein E3G68_005314 [Mycobacteroides abscessus]|uniref:hypothetical protein n=1 Tax=Mycobacteroides abscessus TaxID=36809 RepID=UPI001878E2F4|nr:hypothetical protein [Mycobacteroides abscessus]
MSPFAPEPQGTRRYPAETEPPAPATEPTAPSEVSSSSAHHTRDRRVKAPYALMRPHVERC